MDDSNRSTLRVPGELHAEMVLEARRLGVSLNALVLVAVRDYLDRRSSPAGAPGTPSVLSDRVERPQSDSNPVQATQVPPVLPARGVAATLAALAPVQVRKAKRKGKR